MTTDEQTIAAAGEPVGQFWISSESYGVKLTKEAICSLDDGVSVFPADAILSAAKPLRERIAELEAEVRQLHYRMEHCYSIDGMKAILDADELRQQNAELTKQRNLLRDAIASARPTLVAHACPNLLAYVDAAVAEATRG